MSLVWNDTDITSKESQSSNGGYKDNLDGQLTNRLPGDVGILGVDPSDSSSYKERLKQNVRHVDLWIA